MKSRLLEKETKFVEPKSAYVFRYHLVNGMYQLKITYVDGSTDIHSVLISK